MREWLAQRHAAVVFASAQLFLWDNRIDDIGASYLAYALGVNSHLFKVY